MSEIEAIRMPKWGLAMEEGKVVTWYVEEGTSVSEGDDLVDIETSKITNVCEAPNAGTLRRIVAPVDETLSVGALLGVIAPDTVSDSDIDAFISDFQANFDPAEAAAEEAGPEIREIDADGVRLRVAVSGEDAAGTPLVLLHGFGGDMDNWVLVQEALGAERPVYSLELPGHGQSGKDVGKGRLEDIGKTVTAGIDKLGLDSFILVGHSLGGSVAIDVASRSNAHITALALVCPAGLPGGEVNAGYIEDFVAARRARDLREPAKLLFADESMASRDMLEDLIRAKRLDGAKEALTAIGEALKGGDPAFSELGDKLNALDCPVTLIISREDRIVGTPDSTLLADSVKTVWVDDAGHMPHIEQSAAVAEALRQID